MPGRLPSQRASCPISGAALPCPHVAAGMLPGSQSPSLGKPQELSPFLMA